MASHLNSFLYVEMDREFIETPYQTFEVISPATVEDVSTIPKIIKTPHKMTSLKDVKVAIKEGCNTN